MKTLLILILLFLSFDAFSANRADDLKTILPEDIFGNRKSWGVNLKIGGDSHSGNVEKKKLSAKTSLFKRFSNLTAYWDTKADYLGTGEDPSIRILNAGSTVLRLDHHFDEKWRIFFFSTHAYNEFLKLDYRTANGIGPWWDYKGKNFTNGLSLALTYEHEDFETGEQDNNARLALRNNFNWKLSKHAKLELDFFYVPKVDEFSDNRILTSVSVNSKVYKDLIGLEFGISHERDSRPPAGVLKNDVNVISNLTFNIGE